MFHTIWSVDLGKSALKAVKLRRDRNNVEILAIDKVDYPLTASGIATSGVEASAQAKEAISVFRARNEVREPLILAHPGQGTFSRFIQVPAFDAKKVKDMVRYEASQQIPFPLDEVIWDFHIVDRDYVKGEERDVGLFAARREAIDDFLLDFTNEGLQVEMLTIGYLGTLNFVLFDLHPDEPSIVLDIGATHTDLIFVDGKRFWIRPIPHSGSDITRAIMSRFKLDFPTAERLKEETAKKPKHAAKIFQAVIQPKLQELVQEVHRSIGYYRSQSGEVKFTGVYLVGNGSKIIGIKKHLQDHLGIPVSRLDSISRLRVNREVNVKMLQSHLPSFATALGCGLQAVGLGGCNIDLIPREEKIKKEISRKKKHVFIAAGIVLIAIFIANMIISGKIDKALQVQRDAKRDLPRLYEKEVKDLKKRTQEGQTETMAILEGVADYRRGSLAALRTIESVMERIPNAEHLEAVLQKGRDGGVDPAKLQDARAQALEKLKDKVWIPYVNVTFSEYPEGDPRARRSQRDKIPTVPAYKVTAYAMVTARENQMQSDAALRSLFADPIEKDLKLRQETVQWGLAVRPDSDQLRAIFRQVGRGVSLPEEIVQEGQPFYGAEVVWWMLPRNPPETEKPAAEESK